MPEHVIAPGDCMNSVALQYGFDPKALWNHPDNAQLKQLRKDPNVLREGDVVHIPEKSLKTVSGSTGQRHTFKRKAVPAKLNLRLMNGDKPRGNEAYTLDIDGKTFTGKTDGQGWIRKPIPPDAKGGLLKLKDGAETYDLKLGHLDPIDETSGIQSRLRSLGYYAGDVDGEMNDLTTSAITKFQGAKGLTQTGRPDQALKDALRSEFKS